MNEHQERAIRMEFATIRGELAGIPTRTGLLDYMGRTRIRLRGQDWSEDMINAVRARMPIAWRDSHRRGTPGRKVPPKMDRATQAIFRGGR